MSAEGKTALITGGASGLGEACARRFASDGMRVALLDINEERGKAVAEDIEGAIYLLCDVADAADVDEKVAQAASELGRIDACVTSAGILENSTTVLDADMEEHDNLWKVNYNGTVHTCRAVGRIMREQGAGAIVTLGSINSLMALPLPAYCPSKTAIDRLTQMLACELGQYNVRVNSIAPTYVLTPALQARIDEGLRDPDLIKNAGVLDMFVMPEDIADAVAFLCSGQARAITGIILPVDAGHLAWIPYRSYAGGVPWDA